MPLLFHLLEKRTVLFAALFATVGFVVTAQVLPGSEWGPVELNGETFSPEADIFLRFEDDGRYFGNGGCNTFRGRFVTNEDAILFSPAATTMMACPDTISGQEFQFLKTLATIRLFERDGLTLDLSNADGEVVLRFTQRDAD